MTPTSIRSLCCAALLAALAAGCGSEGTEKPAAPAPAPPGKKVDAATAGSISGQVKFDGAVPPAAMIQMNADPKCVTADANPRNEALLVAADHGVRNAFVWVKDGLDPTYAFDTPTEPAFLDQKGCIYSPRVLGVRVGQGIQMVNSDPTLHNVHALPMVNSEFNLPMPKQFGKASKVFTTSEVMVRFKCDVHPWMTAWVGVVAHPYFAVSDATGAFSLPNLPPGTYTLEAWHEKLGRQTAHVTIGPGQKQSTSLVFTTPAK